jgi:SAM-dependent methyltransferase
VKLWSFLGGPGTLPYRCYDALRRRLNARLVARFRARGLSAGARALEAGSGPGYASTLLRGTGVLGVALDIDREALAEARRRDPALPVVRGDLFRQPFRDAAFDLTWNSSTLEHLARPERAVAEMRRVTRPGGAVFVGVPYLFGPLAFQRAIRRTSLGIWIGDVFGGAALRALAASAGLRVEDGWTYFFRCFIGLYCRKDAS